MASMKVAAAFPCHASRPAAARSAPRTRPRRRGWVRGRRRRSGRNGAHLSHVVPDQAERTRLQKPGETADGKDDAGGGAETRRRTFLVREPRRLSAGALDTTATVSPRPRRATAPHGTVPALLPSPEGTECGGAEELVPTSYVCVSSVYPASALPTAYTMYQYRLPDSARRTDRDGAGAGHTTSADTVPAGTNSDTSLGW